MGQLHFILLPFLVGVIISHQNVRVLGGGGGGGWGGGGAAIGGVPSLPLKLETISSVCKVFGLAKINVIRSDTQLYK